VEWRIDIEADSPEEAAAQALVCQRDTESTAVVFDVFDENGEMVTVDLLDSGE
jgi:hypothetical protein